MKTWTKWRAKPNTFSVKEQCRPTMKAKLISCLVPQEVSLKNLVGLLQKEGQLLVLPEGEESKCKDNLKKKFKKMIECDISRFKHNPH